MNERYQLTVREAIDAMRERAALNNGVFPTECEAWRVVMEATLVALGKPVELRTPLQKEAIELTNTVKMQVQMREARQAMGEPTSTQNQDGSWTHEWKESEAGEEDDDEQA